MENPAHAFREALNRRRIEKQKKTTMSCGLVREKKTTFCNVYLFLRNLGTCRRKKKALFATFTFI